VLTAAACSSDSGSDGATIDVDGADEATFEVTGSTDAIIVTDADPGAELAVVDGGGEVQVALFSPDGHRGDRGTVDDEGNLVFARIPAGEGYQVVEVADDATEAASASEPVTVTDVNHQPDQSLYDGQQLVEGLNYIETRDGTQLSAMVDFPDTPLPDLPEGQFPTVINYSGYDTSNPAGSSSSIAPFANLYGYATVQVNVRGTGCSGSAFSFFEASQVSDGYDVVEAVAAQDWVLNGRPGMIGISYAGISQLYVGSTQPPHLAAIAPMSVIDSVYDAVLYPGGIYNDGFADAWAGQVGDNAQPLGQGWEQGVVDEGGPIGEQCEANQDLRSQNPDLNEQARAYPFYDPELADPLTPVTFADRIEVPVFLTGAWQDEQVGGHSPALLDALTSSADLHVALANGTHGEALIPENLQRWFEFLDFYVAERIPEIPVLLRAGAPAALSGVFGPGEYTVPADRFTDGRSYDEALADYQAEPEIRVLFESGAGAEVPGQPAPTFIEEYSQWPPSEVEPTAWYLQPDGALAETEPDTADDDPASQTSYEYSQAEGQTVNIPEGGFSFSGEQEYEWEQQADGSAATYLSEPLAEDLVMAGPASADLWLTSTADDTDLEVTLTEVRPDGQEVYVQSGWLRASQRALDEDRSTELRPVQTHLESDVEPLPDGEPTEVRVEVFPFGHVFREGSQIRLIVSSPGGDRSSWAFDSLAGDDVTDTVWQSADHPSRIVLPVVGGDHDVPDELTPCPGLRGQPCRTYP
jgi:hypothetical protein